MDVVSDRGPFSGAGRLVRVLKVEVGDEIWDKDLVSRNPGPLLWTIALPVNQVVKSAPTTAGLNHAPNGEG